MQVKIKEKQEEKKQGKVVISPNIKKEKVIIDYRTGKILKKIKEK